MKTPLVFLATLLIVLGVACSEKSKSPLATVTPSTNATRPGATPTAQLTATPQVRTKLAPGNISELKLQSQGTLANLEGLSWSADSTQLLVYNRQSIAAIDNKEGGHLRLLASVAAPESIMDVSSSGSFVTRVDDKNFNLRAVANGSIIKSVQTEVAFAYVVLSGDGTLAAVQRQDKIAADLYQLPAGTLIKQLSGFETAAPVFRVKFSPEAKYLVWVARAQVQFQDVATGAFGPQLRHEDFVSGIALRPAADAIATGSGKSVSIWDPGAGAAQQTLEQDGIVSGVAYSPDGNLLAVSTDAGLTHWHAYDSTSYAKIETKPGAFGQVAFSPDGTALGVTGPNGEVSIWTRQGPTK